MRASPHVSPPSRLADADLLAVNRPYSLEPRRRRAAPVPAAPFTSLRSVRLAAHGRIFALSVWPPGVENTGEVSTLRRHGAVSAPGPAKPGESCGSKSRSKNARSSSSMRRKLARSPGRRVTRGAGCGRTNSPRPGAGAARPAGYRRWRTMCISPSSATDCISRSTGSAG